MLEKLKEYRDLFLPIAILLAALLIGGAIVYNANSLKETSLTDRLTASVAPETSPPDQKKENPVRELSITPQDHIRGNPAAPIAIVEFSDLECPFCKRFHPILQQALKEYPANVKWVYKHFPLDQIHAKADKEAEATECAAELGGNQKFWEYTDRIFEITPSNDGLDLALLPKIAQDIGLDRKKFESCLNSGKHAKEVEEDYQEGLRAGVTGTPGSFVNGQEVKGAVPYEQLKSIIEAQLKNL